MVVTPDGIRYQRMYGHLFGISGAVQKINRWSKFAEAFSCCLLCLLVSLYYDDASILEIAANVASAWQLLNTACTRLGFPFGR